MKEIKFSSSKKIIIIPTFITSTRIAALLPFFYSYGQGNTVFCLIVFSFLIFTDLFDGYVARRLKATSKFGSYFDAATDFVLIIGIYTLFAARGLYPIWLLLLIAASFAQFIVASRCSKKLYDPIGKYFGTGLYGGIGLTLIFPTRLTFDVVQYAFVLFFLVWLVSRILSLAKPDQWLRGFARNIQKTEQASKILYHSLCTFSLCHLRSTQVTKKPESTE